MPRAFYTGNYRNVFEELGYPEEEIAARLEGIFQTLFYGGREVRIYEAVEPDMGYVTDTGNHDVRTEGMSYAMMVCVQLDKKEEFDRLWKWTKTFMYMEEGKHQGYFAWSCDLAGNKNAWGPAPDGEEFFAMALYFASRRWGEGEGIFAYAKEADAILYACLHNRYPMWDEERRLIKFIPDCDWSDPSYHVPHFYELFGHFAATDREFWREAAEASRAYLKKACHPETGLCAEYAEYDGTPYRRDMVTFGGRHDWYYSDAYRVPANLGLDYEWFGADEWECVCADRIQGFFAGLAEAEQNRIYETDGRVLAEPALHPVAITATNAQASLAAKGVYARQFVERFWNTPLRTGERRYYDNFLYLFAFMALSGNYRIIL